MTLSDLSPRALARAARGAAEQHAARLALAIGAEIRPPRAGDASDLEMTVESIVRYAQSGDSRTDWGSDAECAADALLAVHGALYRAAADESVSELPKSWLADDADPLALVARAALARIALARGRAVPRAHLAALAGVSGQYLRAQIAEGRLSDQEDGDERGGGRPERPVSADSARAWLAARGTPGV